MDNYSFQEELQTLRLLIGREDFLEVKYIDPNHNQIKPLLIVLEGFLSGMGYKKATDRKQIRLKMLRIMTGNNGIESTYNLTLYQVSTILGFIRDDNGFELTEKARKFLKDLAIADESAAFLAALPSTDSKRKASGSAELSDMFWDDIYR